MITERENVLRAITGKGKPEWAPISDDCLKFCIPSAILERPKFQDGKDWFGCEWRFFPETYGYAEVFGEKHILEDVCDWREVVKFPDLDAIDWEGCAAKDLEGFDRESQLLEVFWESGPFERSHHLMGFEGAFFAMYDEPEEYKAFLNAITDWRIDAMGRLIDAYKPDIIFTHDDVGTAKGPMLSLEMYREFIKPCHKRMIQFIKSKGVLVVQHSCGMIEPFIGDMIDNGADVINHLQGGMNDQAAILKEYGDKVCFFGLTDPLIFLPSTTEEQLRAEMRRIIDTFAPYGRFIVDPFAMIPEHTAILLDEARKYGATCMQNNV